MGAVWHLIEKLLSRAKRLIGFSVFTLILIFAHEGPLWACSSNSECPSPVLPSSPNFPCESAICNLASGQCEDQLNDGATCNDGNLCTTPDSCLGGVCIAGPTQANGTACSDNNLCTSGD